MSLEELAAKAVSECASMVTPEAGTKERGTRCRRRKRLTGSAIAATSVGVLTLLLGVHLIPGGRHEVGIVAASPSPRAEVGNQPPTFHIGDVQKDVGARLVEISDCPTVPGVNWTISLGSGPLPTTPILAVPRLSKGSAIASAYSSGSVSQGWLSMSPPAAVRTDGAWESCGAGGHARTTGE